MNTLFDAWFAERIGEAQVKIPFVKTIFDKECHKCPLALTVTFGVPARQTFSHGLAAVHINNFMLDIGAINNESKVYSMVTLSVNASAGITFSLEKGSSHEAVKAALSLDGFQQELLISHVGKIDMSDLTRDVKALLQKWLHLLNAHMPSLPLPSIGGLKLAKPVFSIRERMLLLEADLVMPELLDFFIV